MMSRSLFFILSFAVAGVAASATAATFPITELGSCRDAKECALYCEVPAHKAACWAYHTYSMNAGQVLAETTGASPTPTPAGITFPIAELGNCTDVQACKTYCDNPANLTACRTFGQRHGLARASTNYGQQTALLARAKEHLGCTSLQQCRAHCNDPLNADQCQALASQYGPAAYRLSQHTLLEKAKTALGCTTTEACRTLCANPTNREQCRAFAEQHLPAPFKAKLKAAGEPKTQEAPLPCTTLAECQAYCSDPAHATACALMREKTSVQLRVQQEPTHTCNTRGECERYCQANPDQCPAYTQSRDYEKLKLQRQLRGQVNPGAEVAPAKNLERFQRSLIERPTPLAPTATPAN